MATRAATITHGQFINVLPAGVFKTLEKVNPTGALQVRKQANGTVTFYWRYSIGSISQRVSIGVYDSSAPPKGLQPTAKGYSVAAAINAAQAMAHEHHNSRSVGGRPALVKAQVAAKQKAVVSEQDAARHTLKNLLNHYCDHLEHLGRRSHKDARSIFKLHIFEAWPTMSALPANQVTGEEIADAMRRVLESGKGRTANKLRSYVRAAYQVALAARSKASIPLHFKDYRVTSNPGAHTVPDEAQNNPDKNPMSGAEMRSYWQIIKMMPGFKGAVLRLHLLTGGQRIEQLVNLRTENVTADAITLYDGKGRPGKAPRPHTVPLIPAAAAALLECKPQGTYALSSDIDSPRKNGNPRKNGGGDRRLAATTLSNWAVEAAADIPGFATKRIRSGVETLLASAKISPEIRGRLQSHGISGVQARHYDGHDYMDEKRHALKTLFKLLDAPEKSNVVPFRAA